MDSNYPWYEVVTDKSLEQGDILEDFNILRPVPGKALVQPETYTLILMTQSCDVPDIEHCVFCPVWTREEMEKDAPDLFKDGLIGHLKKGRVEGLYAINECDIESAKKPWRIVHFQRVLEVEKAVVKEYLDKEESHLRLLPPYREHLSQHFARFFMRVALPKPLSIK